MFTINLEDGREAPSKARKKGAKRLEFLVQVYYYIYFINQVYYYIYNVYQVYYYIYYI